MDFAFFCRDARSDYAATLRLLTTRLTPFVPRASATALSATALDGTVPLSVTTPSLVSTSIFRPGVCGIGQELGLDGRGDRRIGDDFAGLFSGVLRLVRGVARKVLGRVDGLLGAISDFLAGRLGGVLDVIANVARGRRGRGVDGDEVDHVRHPIGSARDDDRLFLRRLALQRRL